MSSPNQEDQEIKEPPCSTPSDITHSTDEVPVVRVRREAPDDPTDQLMDEGNRMVSKLRHGDTASDHSSGSICSGVLVSTAIGAGIQYPAEDHHGDPAGGDDCETPE